MRIAMMTNNYKPFIGGVPVSIERLAKGLRGLGHEVVIFAPEYDQDTREEDRENEVIRYRSWKGKIENGAVIPNIFDRRISRAFAERRFDLIHVHHPVLIGNAAAHYSKKYGIPLVFTYHTKYEEYLHYIDTVSGMKGRSFTDTICTQGRKVIPWYMEKFLKRCSAVAAPSLDIYHYVRNLDWQIPIQIMPTGLPDEAYEKNGKAAEEVRSMLPGGKKYLLCTVSRLEKEKNQYFLIDAVKRLKERMGDDFCFVFVGDGSERKALEEYSAQQGLADTVFFEGTVPNHEVKNYLSASDGFLFASKSETQGIVILEAMAAGTPVAALDGTGVRDVVKDGENGYLVKDDIEEYVERVVEMLTDKENRNRLAQKAKETAFLYHSTSIARMAESFYANTIERESREAVWKRKEIMYS